MGALLSVIGLDFISASFSTAVTSTGLTENSPSIHFSESSKPSVLAVRKDRHSNDVEHISLQELVETRCKSLFTEFRPIWWLFNGHLQTLYSVVGDFSERDHLQYDRKYLRLRDGGTLGLDFAPIASFNLRDDTPIVVVQHGLSGGSHEPYVKALLSRACAPVEVGGLGYRAVVVNFRGCAGVPITTPQLYSAGYTDDIRTALMFIAYRYPKAPLLGLGFSLGANVMTRYIAEEGHCSRLVSGCALGCPWDLKRNSDGLLSTLVGTHIYSRGMGSNLVKLVRRHAKSLTADSEHRVAKAASLTLALKNPTLEMFDDTFTRVAGGSAPIFPLETAHEYYRWASSHCVLQDIRVPFLAINAADDPVVRHVPMDGGDNSLVVIKLTTGGGHLGWYQTDAEFGDRWTTQPVLEWFKLVGEDLLHETTSRGPPLYVDDDGYLREEGRPLLGCKEVDCDDMSDGEGGEVGMFQGF